MAHGLRQQVLQTFKQLHRTRQAVFDGDERMLNASRAKINEEYKKYKNVTNPAAIEELTKFAKEVEHELRTTVIQAVEKEPGLYSLRITPDTVMWDNKEYDGPTEKSISSSKSRKTSCECSKEEK